MIEDSTNAKSRLKWAYFPVFIFRWQDSFQSETDVQTARHPICPEKERLSRYYNMAVRHNSKAVSDLIKHVGRAESDFVKRCAVVAYAVSVEAFDELERHRAEHGC